MLFLYFLLNLKRFLFFFFLFYSFIFNCYRNKTTKNGRKKVAIEDILIKKKLLVQKINGLKEENNCLKMKIRDLEDSSKSLLALIAGLLEPIFRPLGLGDWRICTSLISGVLAKESVVSTMEILFADGITSALTQKAAASMLVFSLLYSPCIAAIASVKRELGNRWALGLSLWQCAIAWICALIVSLVL